MTGEGSRRTTLVERATSVRRLSSSKAWRATLACRPSSSKARRAAPTRNLSVQALACTQQLSSRQPSPLDSLSLSSQAERHHRKQPKKMVLDGASPGWALSLHSPTMSPERSSPSQPHTVTGNGIHFSFSSLAHCGERGLQRERR
ncbi:hypothetical protein C2S51_027330 [Perilla frutescens var. frutescens]|nr:hypothetical protein C2S51_027330 [Perilla frutescens var. frutescens]